jgi:hypothetical protein
MYTPLYKTRHMPAVRILTVRTVSAQVRHLGGGFLGIPLQAGGRLHGPIQGHPTRRPTQCAVNHMSSQPPTILTHMFSMGTRLVWSDFPVWFA